MCEQHSTSYGQSLEPESHRQASSTADIAADVLAESCDPVDLSQTDFGIKKYGSEAAYCWSLAVTTYVN